MGKQVAPAKKHHGSFDNKWKAHGKDLHKEKGKKTQERKRKTTVEERELSYRFYTHFHPYSKHLIKELITHSISGLQAADTEYVAGTLPDGSRKPKYYEEFFKIYQADAKLVPSTLNGNGKMLHPVKDLDFSSSGAYSVYNWELFYHVPFTLAVHLSKNQRYEEAMKWFHYIFDPGDDSPGPSPERYWRVKPFQQSKVRQISQIMTNLSSGADDDLMQQTFNSIKEWKNAPFRPHVIARFRQSAFMINTVMAYLDNLVDWGDSLFMQDTGEAINEASQLYIMAANILGPKPQVMPKKGNLKTQTYESIKGDLDAFGNVLREIEVEIPFDLAPSTTPSSNNGDQVASLGSIGSSLYFCIPQNNKMLGYWDTVADRLYKIHNSLNLQGVFRQLPLFEPEIDPALLARAAASGLDVASIMGGLHQPLPLVRFKHLLSKANEICQEVKSFGSAVLSCIEKEDGEALGLIRAKHETQIQQLLDSVKYAQWQEAKKNREGLQVSLKNAAAKYVHYEALLGNLGETVDDEEQLDTDGLEKRKFNSTEKALDPREVKYGLFAEGLDAAGLGDLNVLNLNMPEGIALIMDGATVPLEAMAIGMDVVGSVLTIIPEIAGRVTPIGIGAGAATNGLMISNILKFMSSATRGAESIVKTISGISNTVAGHMRRVQEWEFQSQTAAGEVNHIYKQLVAAQIREYITKKEYDNHQVQMQNSKEVEAFLNGEKVQGFTKVTTHGFYAYMKREVKSMHSKYFRFAYEIARKAERALQHELGNSELSFLQFNYMAGREGLYAGEKLAYDIKRMEMAYYDMNVRELELVKHISVSQLNPYALLQLRMTGSCTISIPEEAFDIGGCEGHYFRRIRSVAVTIPCIAGPYASINCTLTLTKSSIRTRSTLLNNQYVRQENDTERFSEMHSTTSIVTSGAQNDRGMFEFNMNDERYLPFEYAGAVSEWRLELADVFRQFDYQTISDVVLHLNYTARQGGGLLKRAATDNLTTMIAAKENVRMFSLKYDFPGDYHRFITSAAVSGKYPLSFDIQQSHYPYWSLGRVSAVKGIVVHCVSATAVSFSSATGPAASFATTSNPALTKQVYPGKVNSVYTGEWANIPLPAPVGKVDLMLDHKNFDDVWIEVKW